MTYKNVKIKKGQFYLSSKTDEGEGWYKNEFTTPSGEAMVRYHKDLSMTGTYQKTTFKDDTYKGRCLSVSVRGENGDFYILDTPVMSGGKGVRKSDDYFNSIVGPLSTLTKGDKVKMFVNSKNKDKRDQLYRNVVFLDGDGVLIKSPFSFSDVPAWVKSEGLDEFDKPTVTYDASAATKFYIDKAKEVVAASESAPKETPSETPASTPIPIEEAIPATAASITADEAATAAQVEANKKAIEDLPDDDLPF
jgi:hypothetical protein